MKRDEFIDLFASNMARVLGEGDDEPEGLADGVCWDRCYRVKAGELGQFEAHYQLVRMRDPNGACFADVDDEEPLPDFEGRCWVISSDRGAAGRYATRHEALCAVARDLVFHQTADERRN